MANSNQAKKRVRQNIRAREHNRAVRSDLRTCIKKYRKALDGEGDADALIRTVESKLDKAVKRHIVPGGRADRIKSRLKKLGHAAAQSAKAG